MHNGCDKCRPSGGKAINWDHLEQIASRKGMEFEDVLYICLECRGHWFYQWWDEERDDMFGTYELRCSRNGVELIKM